jgi:hypothetical protein
VNAKRNTRKKRGTQADCETEPLASLEIHDGREAGQAMLGESARTLRAQQIFFIVFDT